MNELRKQNKYFVQKLPQHKCNTQLNEEKQNIKRRYRKIDKQEIENDFR